MSRKQVNPSRRFAASGSFGGVLHPKSRIPPLASIVLIVVGLVLFVGHFYGGTGKSSALKESVNKIEAILGDSSCTFEVQQAIPTLQRTYGDRMHKLLHVGPDTCSVVSRLLREDGTEAWGLEPYDMEDTDANCKSLVHKGIVRVADIKFPLPYGPKSFSLVVVSDAFDYLTPKYLNKTVPDLVRMSSDGLVMFAGFPGKIRAKVAELSRYGRPAKMRSTTWWTQFFEGNKIEENEEVTKRFEQAAGKEGYKPRCQIFHLKSFH